MKPASNGVPDRPSITTPAAIEPTTVALQAMKNGSRQREATRRRRGSRHIPALASIQPTHTLASSARWRLPEDWAR